MSEPIYQIQLRRGTAAEWTSANPVLASGEPGFEMDTGLFKLGDGITPWNSLRYTIDNTVVAPIESPEFTGNPTAPTPPIDDNDTSIATTEYVIRQGSTDQPVMDGIPSSGTSKRYSRGDHVHPSDTTKVGITGPQEMQGPLAISNRAGPETSLWVDAVAGGNKYIGFMASGQARWALLADGTPETGGDTGTDFSIFRWQDNQNTSIPFAISRRTGRAYLNNDPIVGLTAFGATGLYNANPPNTTFTKVPMTIKAGVEIGTHPFYISGGSIGTYKTCYIDGMYAVDWNVSGDAYQFSHPINLMAIVVGDILSVEVYHSTLNTRIIHALKLNTAHVKYDQAVKAQNFTPISVRAYLHLRVHAFSE